MTRNSTSNKKINYLILCGVMAAVMTICSWITIQLPFTPVPINLGLLGAFLAGGLLGPKYGSASIGVYVLLGAVGLPVFAGMRGGIGVLAGPTGGYIVGFIVAAFLCGLFKRNNSSWPRLAFSFVIGMTACYLLGTVWFVVLGGSDSFWGALSLCVIPFIPGDIIKICLATLLVKRLSVVFQH